MMSVYLKVLTGDLNPLLVLSELGIKGEKIFIKGEKILDRGGIYKYNGFRCCTNEELKIKYLKKIEKICKVLHDKYGKHIELILVLDILDKQGTSGVIIDKESLAFIHRMGAEIDIIN